jgi:hypothetical protein
MKSASEHFILHFVATLDQINAPNNTPTHRSVLEGAEILWRDSDPNRLVGNFFAPDRFAQIGEKNIHRTISQNGQ